MTSTRRLKKDFKAYVKQHPPRYKVRVNLATLLYVWDDHIVYRRPPGALAVPVLQTQPTRGVHVEVVVGKNKPTMRFNGAAHLPVHLQVTGPGFAWTVPLPEGKLAERTAYDAAAQINAICRAADARA